VRVLSSWTDGADCPEDKVKYPQVIVPALTANELLEDAIAPIARDGAGLVEVGIRLQKAMQALMRIDSDEMSKAAFQQAQQAFARAETTLSFAPDRARLSAVVAAAASTRSS
jgi:uncharacterized membrane protein